MLLKHSIFYLFIYFTLKVDELWLPSLLYAHSQPISCELSLLICMSCVLYHAMGTFALSFNQQ
jgi:hypothetical protein